jgi:hypothetical protein
MSSSICARSLVDPESFETLARSAPVEHFLIDQCQIGLQRQLQNLRSSQLQVTTNSLASETYRNYLMDCHQVYS